MLGVHWTDLHRSNRSIYHAIQYWIQPAFRLVWLRLVQFRPSWQNPWRATSPVLRSLLHTNAFTRNLFKQAFALSYNDSTINVPELVDYQLVTPGEHRCNAVERAIQTFKNHFIVSLCSTNKHFPLHLWDRIAYPKHFGLSTCFVDPGSTQNCLLVGPKSMAIWLQSHPSGSTWYFRTTNSWETCQSSILVATWSRRLVHLLVYTPVASVRIYCFSSSYLLVEVWFYCWLKFEFIIAPMWMLALSESSFCEETRRVMVLELGKKQYGDTYYKVTTV